MKQKLIIITGFILILLTSIAFVACIDSGDTASPGATASPEITESPLSTVTTESGLKYIEIEKGTGIQPQTGDILELHYTGTLDNGTTFDSSIGGDPFSFMFGITPIMPGFEEGISMMKEGGKSRFIIPPELGYGGTQVATVPANSTLNFDVELLSVQRPDPPQKVAEAEYKITESGLKYYDFVIGDGAAPQIDDAIVMHNSIWRADGTSLGSTHDAGVPQTIQYYSGRLFPGWEEGLAEMQAGGKRQLVIPPQLAYGDEGYYDIIPPGTTLVMEIDLLAVIPLPEFSQLTPVDDADYEVTASGLKYYDLEEGQGPVPQTGQMVFVHYSGWLTDGTLFDSSINRGLPLMFTLGTGQVIPGFEEGVATMTAGSKRQLVIPSELGYRDEQVRIFEVELVYVL